MNTKSNTLNNKIPGVRVWSFIIIASLLLCGSHLPAARGSALAAAPGNNYAYTLDETTFSWIDGVQATGLHGPDDFAGPFDLGFSFRFFGRTYTQAYVNTNGFISFDGGGSDPSWYNRYATYLPKYTNPNNIIAAMWMPLKFVSGSTVRYSAGGTAPNRYFIVEWVKMRDNLGYNEQVWFEAVLWEDGDILLQYYSVPAYSSFTAGIEDENGWDGLQVTQPITIKGAFLFSYPDPAARPRLLPAYQAALTRAGQPAAFSVDVLNAGDQGNDTFDLSASSTWPVTFFASNGTTPLTDSDGDSIPDTGSLAPGARRTVVARVAVPGGQAPGANITASLVATSSLNNSARGTAQLHTIVPASFAQVYTEMSGNAMYLELIEPGQRKLIKAGPDGTDGNEPAVATTPGGDLVYVWSHAGTCYTLLDKTGASLRAPGCLTDLGSAPDYTWESNMSVAVAPDGKIALFWMRQFSNYGVSPWTVLANLYFAVLNADGSLAYGPANLTGNTTGTPWAGGGRLFYKNLSLAAAGADRFVLAWEQETMPTGSQYINDVYIAVRSTSGAAITAPTRITSDTGSSMDQNNHPNLASLNSGRVLLSWYAQTSSTVDTYFAVLNNAGGIVKSATNLTAGTAPDGGYPDAVQLTGSNILVAWPVTNGLGYALLDDSYNLSGQVHAMINPYTTDNNENVSVTTDGAGRGIFVWSDIGSVGGNVAQRRPFIYYALVDGTGAVLTPPAILSADRDSLDSSLTGFAIAPYAGSAVDVYVQAPTKIGAQPGGVTSLSIQVGNQGGGAASQVKFIAELDAALTYLGATPAPSSNTGNIYTWNLSDLAGGAVQTVSVRVRVPVGATLGTLYPVDMSVSCSEVDSYTDNDTQTSQVMAARQLFLPLARR
jgi:hypothetical protein